MQTKLDYNREQYNVVVRRELEEELKKNQCFNKEVVNVQKDKN